MRRLVITVPAVLLLAMPVGAAELYDTRNDFSLALVAKDPEKLKEALFHRTIERTNAALVGRPGLMAGRTSLTVYPA